MSIGRARRPRALGGPRRVPPRSAWPRLSSSLILLSLSLLVVVVVAVAAVVVVVVGGTHEY